MGIPKALEPKQPANLALAGAAAALLLASSLLAAYWRPFSPKRGAGLAFGVLATLAFGLCMLYPSRRARALSFNSARRWLQAHVYLGALGLLCVFLHTGLRLPAGLFGWTLVWLSGWTCLTGLLGVWLQKWIPAAMSEGLRVEALYERIPALIDALRGEADTLVAGASETLERFYRDEARPQLAGVAPVWAYLLDVRSGRERALEPFQRIARFVEEAEKQKVADLATILTEKLELDAHHVLQGVLRRWPVLHVPGACLLAGLVVVHVLSWAWY